MANTTGSSLRDGSLAIAGKQRTFDMDDASDVLSLLKLVHQSPLDPVLKNHLRDLVFTYRQNLSIDDLKKAQQGFLPVGISIAITEQETAVAEAAPALKKGQRSGQHLGISRPQPVFAQKTASPIKQRELRTVEEGEGVVMPSRMHEVEAQETVLPKTETPRAEAPAQVSVPETSQIKEDAPQTPPVIASEEVSSPVQLTGDPNERIKEIKRLVNEKVGNPVNLIESHNELGREYMAALLDAMKKANGGASGGIIAAMDRLEKVFKQVQDEVLSSPDPLRKADTQQPKQETAPAEKREPVKEVTPLPVEHVAVSAPTMPEPTQVPTSVQEVSPERSSITSEPGRTEERSTRLQEIPSVMHKAPITSVRQKLAQSDVPEKAQKQEPISAPAMSDPASGMHSVAKEKQLQDLLRANREKEMMTQKQKEEARIAAMDPLMAPEVDNGLSQLLLEWDLFKKSGFMGSGPKGKEHPLFKKLAPLTMAAVIAGRFEGANPAIKQDIADTMNGWRYAEGIIHEHAETFEHYLRRVVRHILIRQSRK